MLRPPALISIVCLQESPYGLCDPRHRAEVVGNPGDTGVQEGLLASRRGLWALHPAEEETPMEGALYNDSQMDLGP